MTIKEAKVVEALAARGIPVPTLFGYDERLRAALYERVPGRPDLNNARPSEQRAVFEHFMGILAAWHRLDARQLGLEDRLPWPADAYQAAMLEVDKMEAQSHSAELGEPLVGLATEWLRRHAPADLDRVVLLQGDTGPANFLFADGRVTAVIDWEWAHFGDPMEDLGNVAYRNMFHPSGDLAELLPLYSRAGGGPLDYERIMYFRVQQATRTLIALVRASVENDTNSPVAMMLAYRLINDRVTCEAMAEAMGRPLVRPDPVLDERPVPGQTLGQAAARILATEVVAAADSDWMRFRVNDLAVAVECLDRRLRFGPAVDALDRAAVNSLLGTAHTDLAAGPGRPGRPDGHPHGKPGGRGPRLPGRSGLPGRGAVPAGRGPLPGPGLRAPALRRAPLGGGPGQAASARRKWGMTRSPHWRMVSRHTSWGTVPIWMRHMISSTPPAASCST